MSMQQSNVLAADETNEEAQHQNFVERAVQNIREGWIGTLYIMSKDTRGNIFVTVLSMCIDAAQQASLASPKVIVPDFFTNPVMTYPYDAFKAFQVQDYDIFEPWVAMVAAISLVALLMALAISVGYSWVQTHINVDVLRTAVTCPMVTPRPYTDTGEKLLQAALDRARSARRGRLPRGSIVHPHHKCPFGISHLPRARRQCVLWHAPRRGAPHNVLRTIQSCDNSYIRKFQPLQLFTTTQRLVPIFLG